MWVASNDVEQVIDWFYHKSSSQFLGVFVAGDRKFDALLRAVIANRQTIDVILGPSIDVVLFTGADFEPRSDIPIRHISKLTKWTPQFARRISDATIMSTHDIASSLRLGIDDLPGLVLLRKGVGRRDPDSERLVLSLRGAPDVDFLIEFLRAFRKSLERIDTARSTGFRFSESGIIEFERNLHCRVEEAAVIDKREKRIAWYDLELQAISASSDQGSEKAIETEKRISKAKVAKLNAERRIAKLDAQMPLEVGLKCTILADDEITELQAVLDRFERKLSYELARERVLKFLSLSEKMLVPLKRIVKLAVAIKTGGAALL